MRLLKDKDESERRLFQEKMQLKESGVREEKATLVKIQ